MPQKKGPRETKVKMTLVRFFCFTTTRKIIRPVEPNKFIIHIRRM
jgi:hypothetical protein